MGLETWYNSITWTVIAVMSTLGLLALLGEGPRGAAIRQAALRLLRRLSGRPDLDWLDWIPLFVIGGAAFAAVSAYGLLSGAYGCHPPGVSDPIGMLNSGRAFWSGTNPFYVPDCGGHLQIPYGLAAVLLDAVGSFGGLAGIYTVWGLLALSVLPLAWVMAGPDRRYVVLFLGTSTLFIFLIASQIDGATNAIVPVTVLLSLYLARRSELLSAAVGGFLSTARFPNLFPTLGATGGNRRYRAAAFVVGAAVFGLATGLSYLVWRADFLDPVFLTQLGRRSFSVNFYGVLLFANALPSSLAIEGAQAALTLALVLVVFLRVRSGVLAAAIVLTGLALLTPFLSFNILIWLLPVALVSLRARWWVWGIATVGSVNYTVALNVWAWDDGVTWPSAVLDVVLTVLLLGLFVELWRTTRTVPPARSPTSAPLSPAPPGPREVEPHLVPLHEAEMRVHRSARLGGVEKDPPVTSALGP